MLLKNVDKTALREEYTSFMLESGYAERTANTTAQKVFKMWENCGYEYLYQVITADDKTLREMMRSYVVSHYPNQIGYYSGWKTSLKYFKMFLASRTDYTI